MTTEQIQTSSAKTLGDALNKLINKNVSNGSIRMAMHELLDELEYRASKA